MNNSNKKQNLRFAVLAADNALFTIKDGLLLVRLIALASSSPFPGRLGLPGGLVHPDETAEDSAMRNIREKARISPSKVHIEQLFTFSAINRDPRGRVVAVSYLGLVPWRALTEKERENSDASWIPVKNLPKLGYDHNEIIKTALERLRSRIAYSTLASKLLPEEFTLIDLEKAYETILGKKIDRRNFRKKIKKLKIVVPLNKKLTGMKWRPAMLYAFRSQKVELMEIL